MKKLAMVVMCLMLLFSFASCASTENKIQDSVSDDMFQNSSNAESVEVKDMKGDVVIPRNPQRIVDVAGLTEELLILDMKVIASANTSMFDQVSVPSHLTELFTNNNIEIVGNYSGSAINLEKIAELKPDLIILNIRHDKVYEQLKNIAPTVMIDDDINYVNWRGRFHQLGQWFGKEGVAEQWLSDYDIKAETLAAEVKNVVGEGTVAVIEANSVHFGSYYVYRTGGPGGLVYDELMLIPSAGVPEDVWGEVVDAEYFLLIDADHIFFFSDDGTVGETGEIAAWQNLKAVQAGNVYFGENEEQYNMAYTAMGKALYLEKLANALLNHEDVE